MELKNRQDLAKYFATLNFKTGAEIGVAQGVFSEVFCQSIPGLKLYCVDPWLRDQNKKPTDYEVAQEKLKPYGCTLIKDFSVEASKQFKDGSLDFVYIDANHYYDYVMMDLLCWVRKVKHGGIVAGHDYFLSKRPGSSLSVVQAVDAYTKFYNIKVNVIPGNREAPSYAEKHPNFWWRRE